MKTVTDAFNNLVDEKKFNRVWAAGLIHYISTQNRSSSASIVAGCKYAVDVVECGFLWSDTPEGGPFWCQVAIFLGDYPAEELCGRYPEIDSAYQEFLAEGRL